MTVAIFLEHLLKHVSTVAVANFSKQRSESGPSGWRHGCIDVCVFWRKEDALTESAMRSDGRLFHSSIQTCAGLWFKWLLESKTITVLQMSTNALGQFVKNKGKLAFSTKNIIKSIDIPGFN